MFQYETSIDCFNLKHYNAIGDDMNHYKDARLSKKLRQIDVANYLGITRSAYTNIENGKRGLDSEMLSKLADLLEVSTDYLLGRSSVSHPNQGKLSKDERNLILIYRSLNQTARSMIYDHAVAIAGNPAMTKDESLNSSIIS